MKLTVIRTDMLPNKTFGLLDIDGEFFCHTLEDADRNLESNPTAKVYGETAIPRGKYVVVIDFSHRFKQLMPHVLGVPLFDGIRIHPGNTAADTHGCILVGVKRSPQGTGLVESKLAYNRLMKKLTDTKESITLEVM